MAVSKLLGHVCNRGMGKYRNVTRVQYQNVGLKNRGTRVNIRMQRRYENSNPEIKKRALDQKS